MSFWTDIRDPLAGFAVGGPIGAGVGALYDKTQNQGFFEPGQSGYGGDPYAGMPQYPAYNPIFNPQTQNLAPGFKQQLSGINPDQSGLQAYEQSALRSGPSPWANLATAKSYQDQALQADTLGKNNASNVATAQGNLAMRGGSRSGAAERVATAGNTNLLNQQQQNAGQGMGNRSQIQINDEQNRIAQLGQLPGMQLQQAQFGLQKAGLGQAAAATDVQNQMLGNQSLNQYNLGMYNTQGSIWGAGQQANATANSGSSSWVCSAAAKNLDLTYTRDQRRALGMLKRYANTVKTEEAKFYFAHCRKLVQSMEMLANRQDWEDAYSFIKKVILQITAGDVEGAYQAYSDYIDGLIEHFWPECTDPAFTGVH